MKKLFSILTILVLSYSLKSQNIPNPYASIGKPAPKVATLTNGSFDEFFIKDSLVLINNDAISRKTGDIVFSKEEHPEIIAQLVKNEEDKFRFLSVDPIASQYPYYTPYQFAGNTPIQASDLDGKEPDYIVDDNGKLTAPVLFLFNEILSYEISMMQQVNITKLSDPDPSSYAETWSSTEVNTFDKSQTGGVNWLRTLGHEIKHVEQHFKGGLPPFIQRALGMFEKYGRGYNSKDNMIEQPARDAGKLIEDFSKTYKIDGILSNPNLSDERKIVQIGIKVESYFIAQDQKEVNYYKNLMKNAGNDDTKTFIQKKLDSLNANIQEHKKNIENYEKLDKTFAEHESN